MATIAGKMSLEEFLAQPGETFHDFHELQNGEVVAVPLPTVEHMDSQARLEALLNEACANAGYTARREFYITLPPESRRVDVALVKNERLSAQEAKTFFGSPELVIEILSPSNLYMRIEHLRDACFRDECLEFWIINLGLRTVTVYRRERIINLYVAGDQIPLDAFGVPACISVAGIFAS